MGIDENHFAEKLGFEEIDFPEHLKQESNYFRKNQNRLTESLENEDMRLKQNLSLLQKRNHSEMEGQDDEFDLGRVKAR